MEGITHEPTVLPTIKPEGKEIYGEHLAPFLGGLFSAGGRVNLDIVNEVSKKVLKSGETRLYHKTVVHPVMMYNDSRESKIERLKEVFGGGTFGEKSSHTFRWYQHKKEAAKLAALMKNLCPSRLEAIIALQNWANTEDPEGQLVIARELREQTGGKPTPVPEEAYMPLVNNPSFMAGVFESRGLLYRVKHENPTEGDSIAIASSNESLLNAIKNRWGGHIQRTNEKDRLITISRTGTRTFLQAITPYLLSSLSEYQHKVA